MLFTKSFNALYSVVNVKSKCYFNRFSRLEVDMLIISFLLNPNFLSLSFKETL